MALAAAMDALLIATLGVVMVMLVWLHLRLQNLQKTGERLPQLSSKFAQQLLDVRRALGEVQAVASDKNIARQLSEASKTAQELKFMLDRAENTIQRLERAYSRPVAPSGTADANGGHVEQQSADIIDMQRPAKEQPEQVLATRMPAPASAAASYAAGSQQSEVRRAPVQSAAEQALRKALHTRLEN